jgi:hypothetical protein
MVARRRVKFIDSARLHEFTFGCAPQAAHRGSCAQHASQRSSLLTPRRNRTSPPLVRVCRSRYDPAARYLQFELDVSFDAPGFQALFDLGARPLRHLPALRLPLALRGLSLRGRVLLGLSLCPPGGAAPGISRFDASFAEPPRFDVRLEALGLPLGDVPAVEAWVRRSLAHILQERFVAPRRASANAHRMFARNTLAKRAGVGGTLVVVVSSAAGLWPPVASAADANANAGSPSCYVELRYAGEVRRTHVAPLQRHGGLAWGATIAFPVPAWAGSDLKKPSPAVESHAGDLVATVIHWAAPGAEARIGEAAPLRVAPREMRTDVGAPLRHHRLPLHAASATAAVLHLRVGVLPPGAEEYALALAAEATADALTDAHAPPPPALTAEALAAAAGASVSNAAAAAASSGSSSDGGGTAGGAAGACSGERMPSAPSGEWEADEAAEAAEEEDDAWGSLAPGAINGSSHTSQPLSRAGSVASMERASAGGSSSGVARGQALAHAGSGAARSALGDAAKDFLATALGGATSSGAGGSAGAILPQLTQAVGRLASAAVVAAQAAASDAADSDAGGPVTAASFRSPGHVRHPSGMERLLAGAARAVDAAVAAAGAPAPLAPQRSSNPTAGSRGASPGHSRNVSWEDGAMPVRVRGHNRSGSADSALDAALGFGPHGYGSVARAASPQPHAHSHTTHVHSSALPPLHPPAHGAGHAALMPPAQPLTALALAARDDAEHNAQEMQRRILAASARVRELEAAVTSIEARRDAEGLRALIEGARFVLHGPRGASPRHVWLNQRAGRLCWAASAAQRAEAGARALRWVPLALIDRIALGTAHFGAPPVPCASAALRWRADRPRRCPRRCSAGGRLLPRRPRRCRCARRAHCCLLAAAEGGRRLQRSRQPGCGGELLGHGASLRASPGRQRAQPRGVDGRAGRAAARGARAHRRAADHWRACDADCAVRYGPPADSRRQQRG